jgi:hypothetical protein
MEKTMNEVVTRLIQRQAILQRQLDSAESALKALDQGKSPRLFIEGYSVYLSDSEARELIDTHTAAITSEHGDITAKLEAVNTLLVG